METVSGILRLLLYMMFPTYRSMSLTRAPADRDLIGSIYKMQKKMLHLYASLLRRVSLIEAVRKPPREEPWVCAVCLTPLGNLVSLKGHVRFSKLILCILSCVL